jgi:hypothetical protein
MFVVVLLMGACAGTGNGPGFQVTLSGVDATLRFTAHTAPGAGELPDSMKDVSLFIDDTGSSHEPVRIEVSDLRPGHTLQLALDPGSGWSWSSGDPDTDSGGVA